MHFIHCYRTQRVDLGQERSLKMNKMSKNYCGIWKIVVSLHRQKVNRLFRLVVIDLGF
jgi:hypothetical protein